MTPAAATRARRALGLAGLLGAAGLLVGLKAVSAPAARKVHLAAPRVPAPATSGSPRPSGRSHSTGTASPRTVLGATEDNPYGTVQVRLTITGGKVSDVTAVQLPTGGRSTDISAYAAPQLRSEVLAAQSAGIDTVSGASYTSDGYARSVQAALDAAHS